MYQAIGFSTISDIKRLAYGYTILAPIIDSPDKARKRVAAIFDAAMMQADRTKIYNLTDQRMLSLAGAAASTQTKDADLEIYTFIHVLLNVCGRTNQLPPTLRLRVDPSMSISEAVYTTGLSYIDLSKFKNYLPPTTTHILAADIGDAIYFMLKDFDRWNKLLESLFDKMKSLVAHLKWKVKMGQPVDSFDKTLILHAGHPVYGRELQFDQPRSPKTLLAIVQATECGDPLVFTFLDRLKQACLPGPKFSFIPLISNVTQESLFASYGPSN